MSARVTVSAIMSTFNAMPHVKAAIDSVLAQTFTDWELIVVDTGSTDGTAALLDQYDDPDKRDERIRIFKLGDLGEPISMAAARNFALDNAAGKYIAIMASDTASLPTRFATEVAYLEHHREIHIVASQVTYGGRSGQPETRSQYPEEPDAIQKRFARGEMAIPFATAMIRSWCFARFGHFREDVGQMDALEWCLRVRRNCNFRVLPDALCQFRHGIGRVTFRQWLAQTRYERYAMYRAGTFGTNVNGAALSYDRFTRRWQTRLTLSTRDTLRFITTRLRSTSGGRKPK